MEQFGYQGLGYASRALVKFFVSELVQSSFSKRASEGESVELIDGTLSNFRLPSSGLQVFYSTTFFRLVPDADPPSVMPDLPVETTVRDYREGRDPLLQAALDYRAP